MLSYYDQEHDKRIPLSFGLAIESAELHTSLLLSRDYSRHTGLEVFQGSWEQARSYGRDLWKLIRHFCDSEPEAFRRIPQSKIEEHLVQLARLSEEAAVMAKVRAG